ncbi:sel1 repeat family protein [Salmonella enterica]|nr:sel1 repeat family protein [Salmonella enterica]EIC5002080.1 sel1 repeat family protein [Salmonella enterica]EIJ3932376.1 sel1 repeat family protein [Salmonella enterica]EIO6006326.1 sel1 repeat family protein [Salmonella enterica]EIX1062009.1 sel1 repeat family protein [Salmonella enterica]
MALLKSIPVIIGILLAGCNVRSLPHQEDMAGAPLLSGVEKHVRAVTRRALGGDPGAQVLYARWLADSGRGREARKVLAPLAGRGDAGAQYRLACLLVVGGRAQRQEAQALMTQAATTGLVTAQRTLGEWLQKGTAGVRDPEQALTWYRRAAAQGDAAAQNAMGAALSSGAGGLRRQADALVWYRRAAEQGYALAAFNLGNAWWSGNGVRPNAGVAYAWYALAAHNARSSEAVLSRLAQQMMTRALVRATRQGRQVQSVALAKQYIRHYGRPGVSVPALISDVEE